MLRDERQIGRLLRHNNSRPAPAARSRNLFYFRTVKAGFFAASWALVAV